MMRLPIRVFKMSQTVTEPGIIENQIWYEWIFLNTAMYPTEFEQLMPLSMQHAELGGETLNTHWNIERMLTQRISWMVATDRNIAVTFDERPAHPTWEELRSHPQLIAVLPYTAEITQADV